MDNTKKREIVRNFMIGYLIIQVLTTVVYLGFWSLHPEGITNVTNGRMSLSPIFPDYKRTIIPYNIAPSNFRINVPADEYYAGIEGSKSKVFKYHGTNTIRFEMKDWTHLTRANHGKAFFVTVTTKIGGEWIKWALFSVHISGQVIDSHLVYRSIEPGYEKWHTVGTYRRNLESFDEQPIIRNDMTGYSCMDYHSFYVGDLGQMMFHMRVANRGTHAAQDKKISKLNTKTNETVGNMTYPFWRPSGRYTTISVSDIKQLFHSAKGEKTEVFDLEPDVVVYDVENKEILLRVSLIVEDASEALPAFFPDGKWLYFCAAPAQKMSENYDKVRYNLCRVAFNPDRGEISFPIDMLIRADSLSYTFPRISPDGRFLMYTETAYGQFSIWHPDAGTRMMDLESRTAMDMSASNSPDMDSYHSWGSNSDWVVFSSHRDSGLYTLPYIYYTGEDGKSLKPFLLPQEDPDKQGYQLYSYNAPELTKGAVEVGPYEIQQAAGKNKPEQVWFRWPDLFILAYK